ncbi:S9 family peptidase [Rhizosphaericola mali]|uniref:S9 family peptidase n=1 Tax=Rhizosphaericola mali TaxID=2545455 RepID=A0A5P2G7P3_9BACT|nr:DPP IV N-terminal domain-containing protein [Rhizosphaericola mali]QES89223.1 S9 family peptidase [Rhizosphaericola mali]
MKKIAFFICTIFALHVSHAQQKSNNQDSVTYADYERAVSRLKFSTSPLIANAIIDVPVWQKDSKKLTYTKYNINKQKVNVVVDLIKKSKIETLFVEDTTTKKTPEKTPPTVASPDSSKVAYVENYNLWIQDTKTKIKKQLTFDGVKDFGYATDNAGWQHSDNAIIKWSPDSKQITTFQLDERAIPDMYLVSTNVGHPTLSSFKYSLPADSILLMHQPVVIQTETGKLVCLKMNPDFHRGTNGDAFETTFGDAMWSQDGKELALASVSRDYKNVKIRIANTDDGNVREVFEENVATQYDGTPGDTINWHYLPKSNEIIWYSERDNWGHLYLYDSNTGKVKNQITKGDWLVVAVLKVNEKKRKIYFTAAGLQKENPYFESFCSVDFSGKNFKILTPEIGTHQIFISPDESYVADIYSQPNVEPISILRKIDGEKLMDLEKADLSNLKVTGWQPPISVKLKAADGITDLYGLLFQPPHIDPEKKYPLVNYIYPGPQIGSIFSWNFDANSYDNEALPELGFYVLTLNGTGTPYRSKSFHDKSYGDLSLNTLADQIAGIRQLSKIYPIDTAKIGIWGHSGGGFATACAMFRYPDFYKVGISESGNHDNRNYTDGWSDKYNGLTKNDNFATLANQLHAEHLKGKLLLAHGLMDDNVPPYNTFLVIDALEKANKDYDLIVFPNAVHSYRENQYYMMRRRWDYFVTNLLGRKHPNAFLIDPKSVETLKK